MLITGEWHPQLALGEYRHQQSRQVFGGTSEIMKEIIGRGLGLDG